MTVLLSNLLVTSNPTNNVEIFSLNDNNKKPFYSLNNDVKLEYGTGKKYKDLIYYFKKCKDENFKVVVVSMGRLSFESSMLARIVSFKNIYLYEHVAIESFKLHIKLLKLLSFRLAKKIIVLTNNDCRLLKEKYNQKNIVCIPNINPYCHNLKDIKHIAQKSNIALAVGRYTKQKNFSELIDIWSKANIPNWKLYIVGDGPQRSELEALIKNNQTIKLLPSISDIDKLYNKAKIYLMTSLYEGLPMVLIESQSFGLPAVSYDCPTGPNEIIKENFSGFLIPQGETTLFTSKLIELIENENLLESFSNNAIEQSKQFSAEIILPKWLSLLEG